MPKGIYNHKQRKDMIGNTHGFTKGDEPWNKNKALSKQHRENLKKSHWKNNPEKSKKMRKLLRDVNWKGGLSLQPYTLDWTETLRRSIRERDKYTCFMCKKIQGDKIFDVHHIDYDKKNCNPSNLTTLCRNCHMKTNHKRDYWLKFFKKNVTT